MLHSLRLGLLLAMFTVSVVAIVTLTLFAGLTTRSEFSRYVDAGRDIRNHRLQEVIFEYWGRIRQDRQAPANVPVGGPRETSLDPGSNLVLLDPGNIRFVPLAGNNPLELRDLTSTTLRFEVDQDGISQIYQGDTAVGMVYIDPINELELIPAQIDFMQSMTGGLGMAAGLAVIASIIITLYLSRHILNPIMALTRAARQLEEGDLSQRVKTSARGEIGELAHAFNAMAESLSRNETLRRNMVSDIAHELRTPLTNIRGYLEAVQDGFVAADTSTIDLLYDETMLLNRLIMDLQELALAEAGQLHFVIQPASIDDIIEQAVHLIRPSASRKQIDIRVDMPPNVPTVLVDHRRIAQVLRNLMNNAINYTPDGGQITIRVRSTGQTLAVNVHDTGIGIEASHLPLLFERFYRVDASRSRQTGGAGLGLAITKHLIEAQGGTLGVVSKPGQGSCFSFTLPVSPQLAPG